MLAFPLPSADHGLSLLVISWFSHSTGVAPSLDAIGIWLDTCFKKRYIRTRCRISISSSTDVCWLARILLHSLERVAEEKTHPLDALLAS